MSGKSILHKLKTRKVARWRSLIMDIECIALRGKVSSIVFWDFFSGEETSRKAPYFLKREIRKYKQVFMETCLDDRVVYEALIKLDYPEHFARRRSVTPIRNPDNNNERRINEIRNNGNQGRTAGLCPFSKKRSGVNKDCCRPASLDEGSV